MMNDEKDFLERVASSGPPTNEPGEPMLDRQEWQAFWANQLAIAERRSRRKLLDQVRSQEEHPAPFDSQREDPTRLSQQLEDTRHASLVSRLGDASDKFAKQWFTEVFSRLIVEFARRRHCPDDLVGELVPRVIATVAARIHELRTAPSVRDWLFSITRDSLAAVMGAHPSAFPVAEQERLWWRAGVKRCLLEWLGKELSGDVNEQSWGLYWQVGVENDSIADVAKSANMSVDEVANVVSSVEELVNDRLAKTLS